MLISKKFANVFLIIGLLLLSGCNPEAREARRIQENLENLEKIKAENAAKDQASAAERLKRYSAAAIDVIKTQLKDPFSAQFQNIRFEAAGLCGEVNAKNAMGGYTGFKTFYVEMSSLKDSSSTSIAHIEDGSSALYCK